MGAEEIPISADLWNRLRRLDGRCLISLQRRGPDQPQWRAYPRVWAVMISLEGGLVFDYVKVERPKLADALLAAVEDAEQRGWSPPGAARDAG